MTDKSRDAYRTISEAGEEAGLPAHVLRFWESKFTQLKPVKRAGGRRLYRPQDVTLLKGLKRLLYEEGYTIKGAQKYLKEHGVAHVSALGEGDRDAGAEVSAANPRTERRSPQPHEPVAETTRPDAPGADEPADTPEQDGLSADHRARLQSALEQVRAARTSLRQVLEADAT